ncbi:hypothetical protein ACS0PU_003368, partial [Formica fusca]
EQTSTNPHSLDNQ